MKRELKVAFLIAIIVFISFVFLVKYTENINNYEIQSSSVQAYENYSFDNTIKYQESKVNLWLVSTAVSFAFPILFIITGFSAFLRNRILSRFKSIFIIVTIFFLSYSLLSYLISIPMDYYGGYYLKHSYGLSNQEFLQWFDNSFKSFIINTILGSVGVFGIYLIIRKSPKRWWLYTGVLSIPIIFFLTFITPVYIDPIFSNYENINNQTLTTAIQEELKTSKIENCNVYMVNKSKDTKEMNAYMTGVFSTKRIVLWDTTVNGLSQKEVLSVTAHEIGHYVMGHIWKAIVLSGALTILLLFMTNKGVIWIIEKSKGAFGFSTIKDIAAIPLIILLFNILIFITTPMVNAYSRYTEREADIFELELTKDTEAALTSTIKLHEGSLIIPTPGIIYKLWNYDHPTFQERLNFAETYVPWKEGKPLKYEKYFEKR